MRKDENWMNALELPRHLPFADFATSALLDSDYSEENIETRDCIDCKKAIQPARLAALPHAVRCVRCQTKFEKGR